MKDLGYYESTKSGLTVGIADVTDLDEKPEIVERAHKEVAAVAKQFRRGLITEDERYNRVIAIWNKAKDDIKLSWLKRWIHLTYQMMVIPVLVVTSLTLHSSLVCVA